MEYRPPARDKGQAPSSPSNTNNATSLSQSLTRLTINAASPTPPPRSSQPSSPARTLGRNPSSSSPGGRVPSRSPSSMSIDPRSTTPSLHRKASWNSLHGVGGTGPSRSPSRTSPSRTSPSRRSSSSSFMNGSTSVGKSPLSGLEDTVETPRHTAQSIASNHFRKELERHNEEDKIGEPVRSDTVVILHEACYGHRYSRPRTTRQNLETIVERPERINACILGLSVAYVRLGERHAEGQYSLHPNKDPSAIPTTPFRIRKSTRRIPLTSLAVTNVHGAKWMEELKVMCESAEFKLATNGKELTRPDMGRKSPQGDPFHEGDLYLCEESLNAMEGAMGAVCDGVDAVFQGSASGNGPHRAFVTIRPPGHHCSADYPSGFCWINNVHVGISYAALTHGLTHAAILDFDLHHGDGSQDIAYAQNTKAIKQPKNALAWKKTSIGYFSLHDINSYPCEQGNIEKVKNASLCIENAHGQSIWNVHLQEWKSEREFWELYETRYLVLLEKTRNYLRAQTERLRLVVNGPKPKGAIFLSAGFDASEWEGSGMQRHKVNVPTEFYARLTQDVVKLAAEEGCAVDGRIISVLEGGYSNRALCTGVFSHLSGLAGGDPVAIKKEFEHHGLGYEMGQKVSTFDGVENLEVNPIFTGPSYDPSWWSLQRLEQLDATVNPLPAEEPKKPREGTPPTYSSPTTSFIAKVTSPDARRRVSNMGIKANGSPRPTARPVSPPPPEVDWTVAAHELSKLLIPSLERQTESYKFEELAAAATKVRRDRQSIITPIPSVEPSEGAALPRMGLRVRKAPKAVIDTAEEEELKKTAARANRRKTVAGAASLTIDKDLVRSTTPKPEPSYSQATKQSSRRLSTTSTTGSAISDLTTERPIIPRRTPSIVIGSRPTTSASMRPDSSMSARAPNIVVKKARAPLKSQTEAPKASRVRRKSPLNVATKAAQDSDSMAKSSNLVLPSIEPTSQTADMDSLTAGMGGMSMEKPAAEVKKPRVRLLTKAQREAKNRSEAIAQATVPATVPILVNSAPAENPETENVADNTPPPPAPRVTSPMTAELKQENVTPSVTPDIFASPPKSPPKAHISPQVPSPSPSVSLPEPAPQIMQEAEPQPIEETVFIPYQPDGPPAIPMAQQTLHFLPPNTTTPANMKRERADLPVWSSTGVIPFGVNPALDPKGKQDVKEEKIEEPVGDSIWEVPDTPDR